jgi:predicted Zn-dependent peptidase
LPHVASRAEREVPVTRVLAPGVRLHVLSTDRFTTTFCRVALDREMGPEAAATSILGHVLQSATARHPTREALAHRLADLYGASLAVGAEKLGDRQLLAGSLEWPTAHVPRPGRVLEEGLRLLREVWAEPKRAGDGVELDHDLVETEQVNHVRSLRALRNDKARYAARRCLEVAFAGEPFGMDVDGREEDVPKATPAVLADLHARLLAEAPVEIFLVGDLTPAQAERAVRRHLLWTGRARRPAEPPPAGSAGRAHRAPRRVVEADVVTQGKLVMAFRAPIEAGSALTPGALTLAGTLGGGPYARLFKVVREVHGLCYYANAGWNRAKGLMLVQSGIDPATEPRATKEILALVREVASGVLEPSSLHGYREAVAHRVASMKDDRGALLGWVQECLALGVDTSPARFLARLRRVTPSEVRRAGAALRLDTTFFLTARAAARSPASRRVRAASGARARAGGRSDA